MINIKLLFICSRNRWSNFTAEKILDRVDGHDARSAVKEVTKILQKGSSLVEAPFCSILISKASENKIDYHK